MDHEKIKELYKRAGKHNKEKKMMEIDPRELMELLEHAQRLETVFYVLPGTLFIRDPLIKWLTEKEIMPRLRQIAGLEERVLRRL